MKGWMWMAAACAALSLAGCKEGPPEGGIGEARLVNSAQDTANWITYGRDYSEQRYSPLDRISTETVGDLGLAWFADLDTARGQEGTPLVIDGKIYITTAWSKVKAYDAATGEPLWEYDPEVPGEAGPKACCDVVNRGMAACSRPAAAWFSKATPKATWSPTRRTTGASCGRSTRRRGSSPHRSHTP